MRTGRRVPPLFRKLHAASSEVTIRSKKQHFLPSKREMPFLNLFVGCIGDCLRSYVTAIVCISVLSAAISSIATIRQQ